jgi:hypothetical protein
VARFVVDGVLPASWGRARRRAVLVLYYLAVIVAVALVHTPPDSRAMRFVYQAF